MKRYVCAILLSAHLFAALVAANPQLPEGKGKDVVESTCMECHSLDRIQAQHLSEDGWNGVVREMMESGAAVNPSDINVIVAYLAKNFGPDSAKKVNVNQASAEKIAAVLELTLAEANAIVKYRAKNGSFKNLSDLQKVPGLADKIEAKKALLEF